jgi:hypothetical protein
MKQSERFALNEHLSEFPDDKTFDEIIELILNEDESVIIWEPFENYPVEDVCEIIENTKDHFETVIKKETK